MMADQQKGKAKLFFHKSGGLQLKKRVVEVVYVLKLTNMYTFILNSLKW